MYSFKKAFGPIVVLMCVALTLCSSNPFNKRIYGGVLDDDIKYLAAVSIIHPYIHNKCSGTIIDDHFIVTSAQCISNITITDHEVVLRHRHWISEPGIKAIFVHEEYDAETLKNNIGLIQVEHRVGSGLSATIEMDPEFIDGAVLVNASGYGIADDFIAYAHTAILNTTTNVECRKLLSKAERLLVHDSTICTISEEGTGLRDEDLGGPLLVNNNLVGIASWKSDKFNCAADILDLFTRVSVYVDWVKGTIASAV